MTIVFVIEFVRFAKFDFEEIRGGSDDEIVPSKYNPIRGGICRG